VPRPPIDLPSKINEIVTHVEPLPAAAASLGTARLLVPIGIATDN
jgi:hypothetical protein